MEHTTTVEIPGFFKDFYPEYALRVNTTEITPENGFDFIFGIEGQVKGIFTDS